MRPEVQEVFDMSVKFFEENVGSNVNSNSALSIITENGVHIYKEMAEMMGLDGDNTFKAMLRSAVDYTAASIHMLSHVIAIMEASEIPGSRVSGVVVSILGSIEDGEDVVILDGYDRDGGEDHAICKIEIKDNRVKVLEVGPNDREDKFYLKHGIWPWQIPE